MGKRVVDDVSMTAVADAFRAKTGKTKALTFPAGFASEVDAVFELGRAQKNKEFWEAYVAPEEDGLVDGSYKFAGKHWNTTVLETMPNFSETMFKSTYRMFAGNPNYLNFYTLSNGCWEFQKSYETNLNPDEMFYNSGVVKLERFGISSKITKLSRVLYGCKDLTVAEFIMHENTKEYVECFKGCTSLKTVKVSRTSRKGCIDGTGLDFSDCPLTEETLLHIIKFLKQQSGTTKTITFKKSANTELQTVKAAITEATEEKGWSIVCK